MNSQGTAAATYDSPRAGRPALLESVAGLSLIVVAAGWFREPVRAWTALLLGLCVLTQLCLAGPLFLALLSIANARWFRPLALIPVAMSRGLFAAATLGLALCLGVGSLYEWSHPEALADPVLSAKSAWLNVPMFCGRLIAYFVLWLVAARMLVACFAPAQDASSSSTALETSRRTVLCRSAFFLAIFAVTWSLASVDWIQSLQPHWFSTIFALRTTSGMVCAGIAAAILLLGHLELKGALRPSPEHYADLGRLLLAFCIVWVYLEYCQHMLIWYTNLPEETSWYAARSSVGWRFLRIVTFAFLFVIPFLVLLLRKARGSRAVLTRLAVIVLCGWALDLHSMIGPPLMGDQPLLGVYELAGLIGAAALYFQIAGRSATRLLNESRAQAQALEPDTPRTEQPA